VLPERIERFTRLYAVPRSYTDYRKMLGAERLDAVLVQIGHAGNGGAIRAAIEAGMHVLVEKTPVATSAEADELVELQRSRGVHVMVGFNRRYMTSYVMAKEIAGRAEFGGVHLYHSQFHANAYDEAAFPINHVIHHLDLARWLLGEIELTHVQRLVVGERRERGRSPSRQRRGRSARSRPRRRSTTPSRSNGWSWSVRAATSS
jgi:predicted dehydrogenase